MVQIFGAVGLATFPIVIATAIWWRVRKRRHISWVTGPLLISSGFIAGLFGYYVEKLFLAAIGLSLTVAESGASGSLMAMFLFVAPFEEALKVLFVWPHYRARSIASPRLGLTYAVCVAAGFAASEGALYLNDTTEGITALARGAFGVPAHLFCAGFWGYWLGSGRRPRGRWFGVAWLLATLLHGLYDHVVFAHGITAMLAAAPLAASMGIFAWISLRDLNPAHDPRSSRPSLIPLREPPSLRVMRRILKRTDRPVMFHWIGIGTLVTMGIMIVMFAAAIFVGRWIGIDFSAAHEVEVDSTAPLIFIMISLLASFPFAGYLIARASSATSVLEPAMGVGLAIVLIVIMLSIAVPVAVVFALAVAPVAFALACGGAWFGMEH